MGSKNSKPARAPPPQPPPPPPAPARQAGAVNPNATVCIVHFDFAAQGVRCPEGHFVCDDCLSQFVTVTWPGTVHAKENPPVIRCMEAGCQSANSFHFSTTELVRHLSDAAAQSYMNALQQSRDSQTYAHAQWLLEQERTRGAGEVSLGTGERLLEAQLRAQLPDALMCPKCKFGPVMHQNCDNLSTWDGKVAPTDQSVYGTKAAKIRNECPNCGFFAANKNEWAKWNGKLPATADAVPPAASGHVDPLAGGFNLQHTNSFNLRARALTGPASSPSKSPPGSLMQQRDRAESARLSMPLSLHIPPPATSTPGSRASPHYDRLHRFYSKYNPAKLSQIQSILDTFRGREETMFQTLVKHYGPEPDAPQLDPLLGGTQSSSGPVLRSLNGSFGSSVASPTSSIGPNAFGTVSVLSTGSGSSAALPSNRAAAYQAPVKYVKGPDGVRRLNPEYLRFKEQENQQKGVNQQYSQLPSTATSLLNPRSALPLVSNMQELEQHLPGVALAQGTDNAVALMQDLDLPMRVGLLPDTMVDEVGLIFAKNEIPIGMMPKLLELQRFDGLEFIIDDSGSMNTNSDVRDPLKPSRFLTRWEEVRERLYILLELLAIIPTPRLNFLFLNRKTRFFLRDGAGPSDPAGFLAYAKGVIQQHFQTLPSGATPAFERIKESFDRHPRKRIVRYFFGDGEPSGGKQEAQRIGSFLKNRPAPANNPFTFMSCTDNTKETEWMKDVEESAPYCAEYDDYYSEADEVRKDHGEALPFTRGLYLVCQLVGAMNPHDLDAFDESVPFTKYQLDELLGIVHNEAEYRHYFTCFQAAQRARPQTTAADRIRKYATWNYNQFLKARNHDEIASMQQYKADILRAHQADNLL